MTLEGMGECVSVPQITADLHFDDNNKPIFQIHIFEKELKEEERKFKNVLISFLSV